MNSKAELQEKRKSSLIVVCTLGVAALFYKNVRPIWMTNLFEGTSFDTKEMGWVLKIVSYSMLGGITAIVYFIINLFKVIYYSIVINNMT